MRMQGNSRTRSAMDRLCEVQDDFPSLEDRMRNPEDDIRASQRNDDCISKGDPSTRRKGPETSRIWLDCLLKETLRSDLLGFQPDL
jgi:hypothetical protein